METQNTKLLNYIYENSQMGVQTINKLLENISGENQELEPVLEKQLQHYIEFQKQAEEHIEKRGGEVLPIPKFTTFMSKIMIDIKTLANKSTTHIAEMMLQGTTMGIIEATKTIKENKSADPEILSLANDLLTYENEQFTNLKALL